ncbi:MAG: hypothetical protein IT376_08305 [Polyangiaceae bacterium]|nr:hypothetical protein [Polyangiaceae bacterium]
MPPLARGVAPGALCLYDPAIVVDGEEMRDFYPDTPLAATGYEIHCRVAGEREEQEALVLGFFEKLKELGLPLLVLDEGDHVLGEYDP